MNGKVLIVDDDRAMCEMLGERIRWRGMTAAWRTSGQEALALLAEEDFDVVVTDLVMKGMSGIELCERVAANRPDIPVIVITAFGNLENAIAAIRSGAYDYIQKPFEIEEIAFAIGRAIQHRTLRDEVKRLKRMVEKTTRFEDLLGVSDAMKLVFERIDLFAASDAPVLVTGESGTGKELAARALHRRSARSHSPFLEVNCAAVSGAALERKLFGSARGASAEERTGLFLRAAGGTLLLDEIGDLPPGLQPALLAAVEGRRVRPPGSGEAVPFDARVVATTGRDIETAVEEGRFMRDLFNLLGALRIDLPPLRARGSDALILAQDFVERFSARAGKPVQGLSPQAAERILGYDWPGNVRELQNCVERAVALARFAALAVDDLPEKIRNYRSSHVIVAADDPSELVPMDEVEKRYVERVLKATGGNKSQAAAILGFDRKTLYRKLERYGLEGVEK